MSDDSGDLEQRRRRVLAATTRRHVFELLSEAREPMGVAELALALNVHENTVRLHLKALQDAGLVEQETEHPSRPGRPAHRFRATGQDPTEEAIVYRRLVGWLADAVRTGSSARVEGQRVGTLLAQRAGAADPAAAMVEVFADEGFAPAWAGGAGDERTLVLGRCPFTAAAAADPATICALHLGMAEGVAEATGGGLVVDGLDAVGDPAAGGCRLRLHRR